MTANVASRGEVFTGRVLEHTDEGWVPLSEGSEVVFRGTVVDGADGPLAAADERPVPEVVEAVGSGGEVDIPAFAEVGNRFLNWSVRRTREVRRAPGPFRLAGLGRAGTETRVVQSEFFTHHVEVVPVAGGLPTGIGRSTEVLSPGGDLTLEGQGLSIERVELVGPNGTVVPVEEPVGSSLQQVARVPPLEQPGRYRVVAHDAEGVVHPSPNASVKPEARVRGDEVRHRGQAGAIEVEVDLFGVARGALVTLRGGLPQIRLHRHRARVEDGGVASFPFTAEVVGAYQVSIEVADPRDRPVAPDPGAGEDGPTPVDTEEYPTETTYDPGRDETEVVTRTRIVDAGGDPVPDTPVETCTSHPGGVEFEEVVTDGEGFATTTLRLPGEVAPEAISHHVYEVPGREWNPAKRVDFPTFEIGEDEDGCQWYRFCVDVYLVLEVAGDGSGSITRIAPDAQGRLRPSPLVSLTPAQMGRKFAGDAGVALLPPAEARDVHEFLRAELATATARFEPCCIEFVLGQVFLLHPDRATVGEAKMSDWRTEDGSYRYNRPGGGSLLRQFREFADGAAPGLGRRHPELESWRLIDERPDGRSFGRRPCLRVLMVQDVAAGGEAGRGDSPGDHSIVPVNLRDERGRSLVGLTLAHEFGHNLGLDDVEVGAGAPDPDPRPLMAGRNPRLHPRGFTDFTQAEHQAKQSDIRRRERARARHLQDLERGRAHRGGVRPATPARISKPM